MTERRAIWSGISIYAVLALWAIMLGVVGCRDPEWMVFPETGGSLLLDCETSCCGGGG